MRTGEGIDIIIMNNSDNYHNNFDYLLMRGEEEFYLLPHSVFNPSL